jgi:antitoxin CptB
MPHSESPPLDTRRRRLLFRANHRGTHETDLLIGGYVAARIHAMSEAEMDALEEVMELPDVDLADWLTGRLPIPPEQDSALLRAMREAALRAGREPALR